MGKHLYRLIFLLTANGLGVAVQAQIIPTTATAPSSATAATVPSAYPTGTLVNFVRSKQAVAPITDAATFEAAGYTQVKEATQYIDGLGRPLQTVSRQATPTGKDMVAPVIYDAFGREAVKYMPYIDASATDGKFKLNPFASQATYLAGQYSGENIFYGKTVFEASPLNRPLKSFAPGNSWAGSEGSSSEHATGMQYLINDANDAVRIWTVSNTDLLCATDMDATDVPTSTTTYGAGQLYKNLTADERGKMVVEYKDKEGKVILKKVQVDDSPSAAHTGWLCTYYVYDDFGQLRFVIPPKAVEYLPGNGWSFSGSSTVVSELCFRYAYDGRNRMIAKKVPGAGWVYMIYDRRDRLTYTQDANMRAKNQWMATLYDQLNRPKTTGMISYSGCRKDLQDIVNTAFDAATATDITTTFTAPPDLYVDIRENGVPTYRAINTITISNDFTSESGAEFETILGAGSTTATTILTSTYNPFPSGANFIALTIVYYDEYPTNNKAYSTANNSKLDDGGNANAEALPTTASTLTKGMATLTKVRVLEDPNDLTKGQWLETVSYYDDKGRVIQAQTDNAKSGIDISTMRYDFTGKVITTYQVHHNPAASTTVSTKTNMLYDHAGRLLKVYKTINDDINTKRKITDNTYDELGQLATKKLGQKSLADQTEIEALDYTYNIRGWLQGINKAYANTNTPGNTSRWFGMQLSYDYGFTQSQFNGNIAGTIWKTRGSDEQRAYGFTYDNVNRLLKGDFTQNNSGWNQTAGLNYTMQMGNSSTPAYDANGNIMAMKQFGFKVGGNVTTPIDDLTYAYNSNSNKLKNVIDVQNDAATTLGDFRSSQTYINALGTKTVNAIDYDYDVNGNMVKDLNKDIATSGITYNHLNLPATITVTGKGTISYTYDAAGNKLRKTTVDNTVSPVKTTVTDYMGGGVYENNALQFIGHEEGRFRPIPPSGGGGASWAADYFVKDHLGNTRVVLTDEQKQETYPAATLEGDIANSSSAAYIENQYYTINSAAIVNNPASLPSTYANNNGNPPYNNNPNSSTTATSAKMYKLNGQNGDKTGLGITLKVMSGDNVDIRARSFWHSNGTLSNSYPITDALLSFLNGFAGTSAVTTASHSGVTGTLLNGSSTTAGGLSSWLNTGVPTPPTKPKAYINWILFDEQFKPVTTGSSSGFDGVDIADQIKPHANTVTIGKNGFLYVYCSNESNQDVFFDNLQVTHSKGLLLEETHYYPFGLTMSGISSKAVGTAPENKYKYNGYELNTTFDLNLYESFFRTHDPQLGRFWQIDPKPDESVSLYAAMNNNPLRYSDPLGDTIIFSQAFLATKYGQQVMDLYKSSSTFKDMLSQYDIGGEGSFFGGQAGKSANNTNVVFDVFDNKETGGGQTKMQVQNNKGEWVDANGAKGSEVSKDSKTRINLLVNPNMTELNSLGKFANIVTHELTVHGAGFMDMSNILHNTSGSDFAKFRDAGNNYYFSDRSRNNILTNGYFNSWVQHWVVGMGLNGYYNGIRAELNATLSKQGKSALPNDAKSYQGEVDRVRAAFQNINQITQLGIYGPVK